MSVIHSKTCRKQQAATGKCCCGWKEIDPIILLKRCPFCGCSPKLEIGDKLAWVLCPENSICRGSGLIQAFSVKRLREGVRVWNTRA